MLSRQSARGCELPGFPLYSCVMLTIHLFGNPEVLQDGQPLSISRRKSRALLYYLAENERPQQREHLLSVFWPDNERESAQQVLRTTLHGLRNALGDGLQVERDAVALAPGVAVDARMFTRNLAAPSADVPKLETVLALYRGPFLDGFNPGDDIEFEQWMMAARERYQRMAVRGLVSLSRAQALTGDYAVALGALERGLALDPLQEDLQRETIRLAYFSGDRAGAIRRYDQLRRLLDEELGVPPMAETRALYDQILDDSLPAPAPVAAPALVIRRGAPRAEDEALPFTGREAELSALRAGLFSGRLLLVEGEPGVGKTRLVEHALEDAREIICLRGAGRELERSLPYQPVVEALRGLAGQPGGVQVIQRLRDSLPAVWLSEAARLMPELGESSGGAADEWRLWEGLRQFLLALATLQPVAVFLDDLQWADSSSLGLLGYLVRNLPAGERVSILAASHPPAGGSPLAALLYALEHAGRLERIVLERFTAREVEAAVVRLAGPAHGLSDWLYEHSEGNLYVLAELVRQARANGWLDTRAVPAPDVQPDLAAPLYGLVQSRLNRLSDAARRILDTAVAAGRDFDFDLVARASGLSEDAALDGLDELTAAGLVRPAGVGALYRFDHSLTMEVAYHEVGEARHRQLHRKIAAAMEQTYRLRPPENLDALLAFHYFEGNQPELAAPHAVRAGKRATQLAAWQQAAAFFAQALDGLPRAAWPPVLLDLGRAQQRGGDAARALESYERALALAGEHGDRAGMDEARLRLAEANLTLARFDQVLAQCRSVLENGLPENGVLAEMWWGTALSLEGADLQASAQHLERAAAASRASGSPEPLALVEFELGSLWAQRGDLPLAVAHYEESLRVCEQVALPALIERRVLAHNNLAYHLLLLGDPRAAEHARQGMELAQEYGLVGLQPYLYSTAGEIAMAARDFDHAREQFVLGLELAQRLGIPERVAGLGANLGLLARETGDAPRAVELLSAAREQADSLGLRHLAAQIRIWLAPLLPQAAALEQLDQARAIAKQGGRLRLLEEERAVRAAVEKIKE